MKMRKYEEIKQELLQLGIDKARIWDKSTFEKEIRDEKELNELEIYGAYSVFIAFMYNNFGYDCKDIEETLNGVGKRNEVKCRGILEIAECLAVDSFYIFENKVIIKIKDMENSSNQAVYIWLENRWD